MRIKSIKFERHHILGNLYLDFCDPSTKEPFHTVILAGENGTGKTLILEEIFSTIGEVQQKQNAGDVTIELQLDSTNVAELREILGASGLELLTNDITVHFPAQEGNPWNIMKVNAIRRDGSTLQRDNSHDYFRTDKSTRPIRVFFSEVDVNFKAQPLTATTAGELDEKNISRRSGSHLAQQISQLLVDIRASDNEDTSMWLANNPGEVMPVEKQAVRINRFRTALSFIFPKKRLLTVTRKNNEHIVEFEEHERRSSLNQLSTGEKQIVFRGGFVLRDLASVQGAVLLVDEPEVGLHPDWQAKIVGFYQRLLPQSGSSTSQLIFATHSPFVVHDQLSAKVIILRKNSADGSITVDPDPSYPTTGQARVVQIFNVDDLIGRAEHDLVVLVEGITDQTILEEAWKKLYPGQPYFFEIRPAFSHTAIRTTLNEGQTFVKNPTKKLVGIFDFDTAYNEWNRVWKNDGQKLGLDEAKCLWRKHKSHNGWSMLLPVPPFRKDIASDALGSDSCLSIELLFEDRNHLSGMVNQIPLPSPGATKPAVSDSYKVPFSEHIAALSASEFEAFRPIFDRLREIRDGKI